MEARYTKSTPRKIPISKPKKTSIVNPQVPKLTAPTKIHLGKQINCKDGLHDSTIRLETESMVNLSSCGDTWKQLEESRNGIEDLEQMIEE